MIRLDNPTYSLEDTLNACLEGVGKTSLKSRFIIAKDGLINEAAKYLEYVSNTQLFLMTPTSSTGITENDRIIISDITKQELISLYEKYLLGTNKPGRIIYNKMLSSSKDKCPFCGGIGRPRNLDHYLPKTYFSQFSILPINLIPSCRDCNMDGKGHSYAQLAEEQIIHPYIDLDCFFNEQWISARYTNNSIVEYYVNTPSHWHDIERKRAQQHFTNFNIEIIYGREAASHLSEITSQAKALVNKNVSFNDVKNVLFQPVIDQSSFPNHWKRLMYLTFINDDSFLQHILENET